MTEIKGEGNGIPGQQGPVSNFTEAEFEELSSELHSNALRSPDPERLYIAFSSKKSLLSQALRTDDYFNSAIEVINILERNSKMESSVLLGLDLVEENLDVIESHLSNPVGKDTLKTRNQCAEAIVAFGQGRDKRKATEIFVRNLNLLKLNYLESGVSPIVTFAALEMAGSSDDKDTAGKADEALTQMMDHYLSVAFYHKGHGQEIAIRFIRDKLNNLGIDSSELIDRWLDSSPGVFVVSENLNALVSLEKKRPGIGTLLNKQFGICNFARYPEEMLIAQYDEVDKTDLPYGVILFNSFDHNGAFYETRKGLNSLRKQLKGKYSLRVVETNGKLDIVKRLHKLSRKYGDSHKISFAIVGGHGDKNTIEFGKDDSSEQRLSYPEFFIDSVFKRERMAKYSGYFTDNPTIVLISCSTGKSEKGIASLISESYGTIIAPSEDTAGSSSFKITEEGGKLFFKVKFPGAKTITFIKGRPIDPNVQT